VLVNNNATLVFPLSFWPPPFEELPAEPQPVVTVIAARTVRMMGKCKEESVLAEESSGINSSGSGS
jgi:hypothetical protein